MKLYGPEKGQTRKCTENTKWKNQNNSCSNAKILSVSALLLQNLTENPKLFVCDSLGFLWDVIFKKKTQTSFCLIFSDGDIGNRFVFLPFLLVRGELPIILFWAIKFFVGGGLLRLSIGILYSDSLLMVEKVPFVFFFSCTFFKISSFSSWVFTMRSSTVLIIVLS